MKFAVLILLAISLLLGCGGSSSFVGTWLVDSASMPAAAMGATLPPDLLKTRKELEAFRLTLKADGSYDAVSVPGVQNGHWKQEGNQVVLDTPTATKLDISSDGTYLTWSRVAGRAGINLYRSQE